MRIVVDTWEPPYRFRIDRRRRRTARHRGQHGISLQPKPVPATESRHASCQTRSVRVVVAEDVMLMREGIVRVLRDEGVEVVAEGADQTGLMSALAAHEPDCAIVDIRMPPTHTDEGIVAAHRIREFHPNVGILLLSQYVEPTYAMQLLEQHGTARLRPQRQGQRRSRPRRALRRLTEGETVIDPTIVTRLLRRHRKADPLEELSEREREVLGLVAEGCSNLSNRQAPVRHRANRRVARSAHLPQTPDRRDTRDQPARPRRTRVPAVAEVTLATGDRRCQFRRQAGSTEGQQDPATEPDLIRTDLAQ
jgi:DNA-binding NarL/FixJ family response regulator